MCVNIEITRSENFICNKYSLDTVFRERLPKSSMIHPTSYIFFSFKMNKDYHKYERNHLSESVFIVVFRLLILPGTVL